MVRTVVKNITFVLCVLFLSHHTAYPADTRDYFDELRFTELQLSAVTTDMYRYLGWAFEEKAAMKAAAQKAQADLEELKMRLVATNPTMDQAKLQEVLLEMIDRLQSIYAGIETKQLEAIKEEFAPFNDLHEQYAQLLKTTWNEPEVNGEIAPVGDSLREELRWIEHPEDQNTYRSAVSLMEERKTAEAYGVLRELENRFGDLPAAHLIRLRMSDSLCMVDAEQTSGSGFADAFDASEHALGLLSAIVESDVYSPVLYEAFYKWRTTTQEFHHGMSNLSEIPNKAYNETRWRVIKTTKKYVAEHPGDAWAKTQLDLLWNLPNIQRGGPFGNDNLVHWGMLYTALEGGGQHGE